MDWGYAARSKATTNATTAERRRDDCGESDPLLDAFGEAADAFMGMRVTKYKERFGFGFLNEEAHKGLLDATVADINATIIPRHLEALSKLLVDGGTGWLAGTPGPTIADLLWAPWLHQIEKGWSGNAEALKPFPELEALLAKVRALPCASALAAS